MIEKNESESVKLPSKTVRISAILAKYLEEESGNKNVKSSEIMDRIFDGYLESKSRLKSKINTCENQERITDEVDSTEKSQNDTFRLIEKQLKSLNEATEKYCVLHNLISVSSAGIRDGIMQAEDAVERILTQTDSAVNKIKDVMESQNKSGEKTIEYSDRFISSLQELEKNINCYFDESIKRPSSEIISHIEKETRSLFKKIKIRSNISFFCSIFSVLSLAFLMILSYSPLSKYNRDMEGKYRVYSEAYHGLKESICSSKSDRSIRDIQRKICQKK